MFPIFCSRCLTSHVYVFSGTNETTCCFQPEAKPDLYILLCIHLIFVCLHILFPSAFITHLITPYVEAVIPQAHAFMMKIIYLTIIEVIMYESIYVSRVLDRQLLNG